MNDRVANQKLDKYLSEYQHREFNKAPPVSESDLKKHLDPKLMRAAEAFFKENYTDKNLKINMDPTAGKVRHAVLQTSSYKKVSLKAIPCMIQNRFMPIMQNAIDNEYFDYLKEWHKEVTPKQSRI